MKIYLSLIAIVLLVNLSAFAQDIPIEAAVYLDEVDIAEIKDIIETSNPDEYFFDLEDDGIKFTLRGSLALEIMGHSRGLFVEPLWGLLEGRYVFDLDKTNDVDRTWMVGEFECSQKRWPRKSDGSSYLLFEIRLYATSAVDPTRLIRFVNEFNVCSKIYN